VTKFYDVLPYVTRVDIRICACLCMGMQFPCMQVRCCLHVEGACSSSHACAVRARVGAVCAPACAVTPRALPYQVAKEQVVRLAALFCATADDYDTVFSAAAGDARPSDVLAMWSQRFASQLTLSPAVIAAAETALLALAAAAVAGAWVALPCVNS